MLSLAANAVRLPGTANLSISVFDVLDSDAWLDSSSSIEDDCSADKLEKRCECLGENKRDVANIADEDGCVKADVQGMKQIIATDRAERRRCENTMVMDDDDER